MSRDKVHTIVAVSSLVLIGIGAWMAWPPLCPLFLGSLLMAGVVYARTRPEGKPK